MPGQPLLMVFGLISGLLVGGGGWFFLDFFVAGEFSSLLEQAVINSPLIHTCADLAKSPASRLAAILPPWIGSGYFRLNENAFLIGLGHIRAAVCFLATTLLHLWLRTKPLPPLCYFLVLTTVIVWGLSRLSFFLDAFRIPLFVPIVLWLSVA